MVWAKLLEAGGAGVNESCEARGVSGWTIPGILGRYEANEGTVSATWSVSRRSSSDGMAASGGASGETRWVVEEREWERARALESGGAGMLGVLWCGVAEAIQERGRWI
jgi:hypothetical protein